MERRICTACNENVTNDKTATDFSCPLCGQQAIVRCGHCRKTAVKYKCPACSFEGP